MFFANKSMEIALISVYNSYDKISRVCRGTASLTYKAVDTKGEGRRWK